jgi:hypothetical protein
MQPRQPTLLIEEGMCHGLVVSLGSRSGREHEDQEVIRCKDVARFDSKGHAFDSKRAKSLGK